MPILGAKRLVRHSFAVSEEDDCALDRGPAAPSGSCATRHAEASAVIPVQRGQAAPSGSCVSGLDNARRMQGSTPVMRHQSRERAGCHSSTGVECTPGLLALAAVHLQRVACPARGCRQALQRLRTAVASAGGITGADSRHAAPPRGHVSNAAQCGGRPRCRAGQGLNVRRRQWRHDWAMRPAGPGRLRPWSAACAENVRWWALTGRLVSKSDRPAAE